MPEIPKIDGSSSSGEPTKKQSRIDIPQVLTDSGLKPKKGNKFPPDLTGQLTKLHDQKKVDRASVAKALGNAGINANKDQITALLNKLCESNGQDPSVKPVKNKEEVVEKRQTQPQSPFQLQRGLPFTLMPTPRPAIISEDHTTGTIATLNGAAMVDNLLPLLMRVETNHEKILEIVTLVLWYLTEYSTSYVDLMENGEGNKTYGEALNDLREPITKIDPEAYQKLLNAEDPQTIVAKKHIVMIDDFVRQSVIAPKGLISFVTRDGGSPTIAISKQDTSTYISPAGITVPVYDLHPFVGEMEFEGLAKPNKIFLRPFEAENTKLIQERLKERSQQYERNSYQRPNSFQNMSDFYMWIAIHRCLMSDNLEKMWKTGVLSEELAHSDAMRFFEAVKGRAYIEGVDGEDERFARTILKQDSPYLDKLNTHSDQHLFSEAITELEAKLLSIAHSNFPAFNLLDDIATVLSSEAVQNIDLQPQYLVCGGIIEEEFRKELGIETKESWQPEFYSKLVTGSLDTEKTAMEEFNQKLRDAALRIYERHFYTTQERNEIAPGWTTYEAFLNCRGIN